MKCHRREGGAPIRRSVVPAVEGAHHHWKRGHAHMEPRAHPPRQVHLPSNPNPILIQSNPINPIELG